MAKFANISMIEAIADELNAYRDDDVEAFWDTLDGETDVLDFLDMAITSQQSDVALMAAIKEQEGALKIRRERIEMRANATKKVLGQLLHAAGMKSAERPAATVSVRPGNMSVTITDADDIPTQLTREKITRSPDKTAIKKQLDAGETVPGAELVRGSEIISVRVK